MVVCEFERLEFNLEYFVIFLDIYGLKFKIWFNLKVFNELFLILDFC